MKVPGVRSRVLKMDWLHGSIPSKIANFESEARRLRYRLLGHACREESIESLLVAHHADDQAETVLVRLSMGHKITGLPGMQQSADIPECWGIHGLCRSGGDRYENDRQPSGSISSRQGGNTITDAKSIPIEAGGISLYRPLLSFPKERLIATCLAEGVEWVEDETNQDPTLTTRNTARQLLASARLPVALQKPSMLALAKSAHSRVVKLKQSAERLLPACNVLSFDNRVGSLVIYFSKAITSFNLSEPYTAEEFRTKEMEHLSSVSILLRRLVELVSPLEMVRLQSLETATKAICTSEDMPAGFTAGGVRFQRSELVASDHRERSKQSNKKSTSEGSSISFQRDASEKQTVWTLSRQPYRTDKTPSTILVPKQKATENFILWDGRFWFHLQNDTPYGICIRPLRPSDLTELLSPKLKSTNRYLSAILYGAARGDIRWTLPVIAFVDRAILPPGVHKVIALPSLNFTFGEYESLIKWVVRYKKIDLEAFIGRLKPSVC